MDLIDHISQIASRMPKQIAHIGTEEATKTAFVMPFISALGYDVFNPFEVAPEFTADVGTKKGEKVDYAIRKDDKVIMLVECKTIGSALSETHAAQLHRYFSVTEARFGVLTNGQKYHFYSDIDEPNKMDSKPFFEFDVIDFEEHQLVELKKFTKSAFSLDDILATASTLKYAGAVKRILARELDNPSETFVRFFAAQIYDGRITQNVLEQFTGIVTEARAQFISEQVNERLKSALSVGEAKEREPHEESEIVQVRKEFESESVVTTSDEVEGYNIVKAICREIVNVKRIAIRDTKSYCGILLDDNNRKPICRLRFNASRKYIGLMTNKLEERVAISELDDIFNHADKIKATVAEYEGRPSQGDTNTGDA